MSDADLFRLAAAAGLAREWTNTRNEAVQVAPPTLRWILDALGLPCASPAQCRASRRRLAAIDGGASLPPLLTGTLGQALPLPAACKLAGKPYLIEWEGGGRRDGRFLPGGLPPLERSGYHRLLAEGLETTLAIAPPRCFGVADALTAAGIAAGEAPRLWGLGVQLYSLRRAGDGGIGDFTGLAQLAERAAAHGAAALAISPVHAMFSADLHRYSPYGPSSRLFLNALHIDPAAVLGPKAGPQALAQVMAGLEPDIPARLARLEQQELIDWPAAGALRLSLLRSLYRRFAASGPNAEFETFCRAGGTALRDHARFEAMHAARLASGASGDWRSWPAGWRDPDSAAAEEFAGRHEDEVRFHQFLQWQAARGLEQAQRAACGAGMPIGLLMDLAVGADNDGSQAWSRQADILNGVSVGAPPDMINTRGQSWGLGAFSPHAMRARGFGAYIEMLRAIFTHGGGARIDHVLGLSRLWLVPQGAGPEEGAYLRYPLQDLLRLVALESWRHGAIVIGEDLGTVPPGFDAVLAQAGLYGIRVLMFQRDRQGFLAPQYWPDQATATTTTHDLPTVAGWWQGCDLAWTARLGLLEPGKSETQARQERAHDRTALWHALVAAGCIEGEDGASAASTPAANSPEAVLEPVIAFIAATPAPLAMLPVEDALGLAEQPNLPGTIDVHPNWRRRLPLPVRDVLDGPAVARRLAVMERLRSLRRVA